MAITHGGFHRNVTALARSASAPHTTHTGGSRPCRISDFQILTVAMGGASRGYGELTAGPARGQRPRCRPPPGPYC